MFKIFIFKEKIHYLNKSNNNLYRNCVNFRKFPNILTLSTNFD